MPHLPLITTIAAAFSVAWLLALLCRRTGLSPIVGYLVAGILIGPHTPGFVGDVEIAHQLAEVGVILLMFGVGLHFSLKDLLAVKRIAVPGAVIQSALATLVAIVVFSALGVPVATGLVLGMAIAVASTVVLMRVLTDAGLVDSPQGHVAVGWLLVEDVLTVIVLVLIPTIGGATPQAGRGVAAAVAWSLAKLVLFVGIAMLVGSRAIPWILVRVARLRSREIFTLTVLVFSIAIAAGSYEFFGASMALGAFLAGMMVAQSPVSHQAAADALPMRDAFAVVFFVSVGMLFDPASLLDEPWLLLGAIGIILVVKPLAAIAIVATMGHSVQTALTVALGLAQIGEFSFIVSEVARASSVMSESGHNVLVAAAILSITLNPILFRSQRPLEGWLRRQPRLWALLNRRANRRIQATNAATSAQNDPASANRLAIVVGYGPVGQSVDRLVRQAGLRTVIVDLNMDTVSALHREGREAIFGDAAVRQILLNAGIEHASHLVVTFPHSTECAAVVAAARNLNQKLRIFVRARYLREREDLEQAGATSAVFEEAESAVALARLVLADTGASRDVVERTVRDLRMRLILDNVSDLGTRTVQGVMVPWHRVHRIPRSASLAEVRRQVSLERFSRWPVVEPATGRPIGYLLAKDLIAEASSGSDWTKLIRPLPSVAFDASISATLEELRPQGTTVCVVEDAGRPVGLLTIEDILEQVVGRIEDEYPRRARVSLEDALRAGSVVPDLFARTSEEAIAELAAAIPPGRVPSDAGIVDLAIARERAIHTDVGLGVAIPHARAAGAVAPLIVFGHSAEGITFSTDAPEPVRLVFLLVTPADQPELQVHLLGEIARVISNNSARERLAKARSLEEVVDVLSRRRGQ